MNICRFRACSSRKELIALRMCSRLSISVPTVASDTEGNQRSLLELIGKTNLKTQHISTLITHVRSEDMWCALEVKRVQVAGSKVRVVIRNFESILWFSDQLEPFPRKILFFSKIKNSTFPRNLSRSVKSKQLYSFFSTKSLENLDKTG